MIQSAYPPYQIECTCGELLAGQRHKSPQVVQCPRCKRRRLVFPASCWPPVKSPRGAQATKKNEARPSLSMRGWLLLPFIGITSAVVLLLTIYLVFLRQPQLAERKHSQVAFSQQLERARQLLRRGKFRLAASYMKGANLDLQKLDLSERRQWQQLSREADIYADLIAEPLEDLLRHAANSDEEEWQAAFEARYLGKSILFDVHLQRVGERIEIDYMLPDDAELDLQDLAITKLIDLSKPQRVLFGARLASVQLEAPGPTWKIRLQPASGVLLTDPEAVVRCCAPLGDAETQALLTKQAKLLSLTE